jgi:hypothetical protein
VTAAILQGSRFGGRIHWGAKKNIPNSFKQTAYNDISKCEVPFTFDGEITVEVIAAIKNAISKKSTGGGVYSSTYSVEDINFSTGMIVVNKSVYIGD